MSNGSCSALNEANEQQGGGLSTNKLGELYLLVVVGVYFISHETLDPP